MNIQITLFLLLLGFLVCKTLKLAPSFNSSCEKKYKFATITWLETKTSESKFHCCLAQIRSMSLSKISMSKKSRVPFNMITTLRVSIQPNLTKVTDWNIKETTLNMLPFVVHNEGDDTYMWQYYILVLGWGVMYVLTRGGMDWLYNCRCA